jgi:hypothetical protein
LTNSVNLSFLNFCWCSVDIWLELSDSYCLFLWVQFKSFANLNNYSKSHNFRQGSNFWSCFPIQSRMNFAIIKHFVCFLVLSLFIFLHDIFRKIRLINNIGVGRYIRRRNLLLINLIHIVYIFFWGWSNFCIKGVLLFLAGRQKWLFYNLFFTWSVSTFFNCK